MYSQALRNISKHDRFHRAVNRENEKNWTNKPLKKTVYATNRRKKTTEAKYAKPTEKKINKKETRDGMTTTKRVFRG